MPNKSRTCCGALEAARHQGLKRGLVDQLDQASWITPNLGSLDMRDWDVWNLRELEEGPVWLFLVLGRGPLRLHGTHPSCQSEAARCANPGPPAQQQAELGLLQKAGQGSGLGGGEGRVSVGRPQPRVLGATTQGPGHLVWDKFGPGGQPCFTWSEGNVTDPSALINWKSKQSTGSDRTHRKPSEEWSRRAAAMADARERRE